MSSSLILSSLIQKATTASSHPSRVLFGLLDVVQELDEGLVQPKEISLFYLPYPKSHTCKNLRIRYEKRTPLGGPVGQTLNPLKGESAVLVRHASISCELEAVAESWLLDQVAHAVLRRDVVDLREVHLDDLAVHLREREVAQRELPITVPAGKPPLAVVEVGRGGRVATLPLGVRDAFQRVGRADIRHQLDPALIEGVAADLLVEIHQLPDRVGDRLRVVGVPRLELEAGEFKDLPEQVEGDVGGLKALLRLALLGDVLGVEVGAERQPRKARPLVGVVGVDAVSLRCSREAKAKGEDGQGGDCAEWFPHDFFSFIVGLGPSVGGQPKVGLRA